MTAQGAALGKRTSLRVLALKGRANLGAPFQG